MSFKRKFEDDQETITPAAKRSFTSTIGLQTMDVDMGFAASSSSPTASISSLPTDSSGSSSPASAYPVFDIYPLTSTDVDMACDSNVSSASSSPNGSLGLLQPKEEYFTLHDKCTQVPKLRLAGYAINGERSLWSHCEECGAISIVRSCGQESMLFPRH